jgi:hypothetical protein
MKLSAHGSTGRVEHGEERSTYKFRARENRNAAVFLVLKTALTSPGR